MQGSERIKHYFPELTENQQTQIEKLEELYTYWNARINVISRKNIHYLYEHHVLPAMAFGKLINFAGGSSIIDVGTGGGFPGIPLAIMMPQANFHLIDAVAKKVKVVQEVANALNLTNVKASQVFSKEHKATYDFVLGRAVKPFNEFFNLTRHLVHQKDRNSLPNGYFYLTGGDVQTEMKGFHGYFIYNLSDYFSEEALRDKKIIYYPV